MRRAVSTRGNVNAIPRPERRLALRAHFLKTLRNGIVAFEKR